MSKLILILFYFIAITAPDITRAMNNLVAPNKNEARAVDARQELDLKVINFKLNINSN